MLTLISAFLVTTIATLLIIRFAYLNTRLVGDYLPGPQKIHTGIVPRIGGLGIFCGLLAAAALLRLQPETRRPELIFLLLATTFPAFISGLSEDFTKRVPPSVRLLSALVSASLGIVLLGAIVHRYGFKDVNELFAFWPLAFLFTIFSVAAMAQATNIIDGFNGLASGAALLMLFAIAYVAFMVHDLPVLHICLATTGAVLGFLVWNYPAGLVFLGDGGAYLIGIIIAEAAIMLVTRNPQVSPWFAVMVIIYPIFETIFSIYRRLFVRRASPGAADALHLHSLIYRRLLGWMLSSRPGAKLLIKRNAMTTVYLWGLTALCVIPAVLFYGRTYVLIGCVVAFACFYTWLYSCIVKFRMPVWLRRLLTLNHYPSPTTE